MFLIKLHYSWSLTETQYLGTCYFYRKDNPIAMFCATSATRFFLDRAEIVFPILTSVLFLHCIRAKYNLLHCPRSLRLNVRLEKIGYGQCALWRFDKVRVHQWSLTPISLFKKLKENKKLFYRVKNCFSPIVMLSVPQRHFGIPY